MSLEHQRGHPGDHRRRLRRARHVEVVRAVVVLGVLGGDRRRPLHHALDVPARRDQVGLDERLGGRPRGRELRQPVVGQVGGGVVVGHRADRDHVGQIAGNPDGHRPRPTVAGRGDHHDPRLPGGHHRLVERVVPVAAAWRCGERGVEHPDAVGVAVGHQPVDAADDVGVGALAVVVEGLDRHQIGAGCEAVVGALRCAGARHRDAGDVRAVAEHIGRHRVLAAQLPGVIGHRVVVGEQAKTRARVVVEAPIGVVPDAAVQDRDRDPGAVDALGVKLIGSEVGRVEGLDDAGLVGLASPITAALVPTLAHQARLAVGPHPPHPRRGGQLRGRPRRHRRGDCPDDAELVRRGAARTSHRGPRRLDVARLDDHALPGDRRLRRSRRRQQEPQ